MVTMKHCVVEIDVPAASAIARQLQDAEFFDCYEVPIAGADVSALEFYLNVVSGSPQWVSRRMALRNHIVGFVGLKNLGHLHDVSLAKAAANLGHLHDVSLAKAAADYRVGDRVGIFSLLSVTDDEVILGDSDKHLGCESFGVQAATRRTPVGGGFNGRAYPQPAGPCLHAVRRTGAPAHRASGAGARGSHRPSLTRRSRLQPGRQFGEVAGHAVRLRSNATTARVISIAAAPRAAHPRAVGADHIEGPVVAEVPAGLMEDPHIGHTDAELARRDGRREVPIQADAMEAAITVRQCW